MNEILSNLSFIYAYIVCSAVYYDAIVKTLSLQANNKKQFFKVTSSGRMNNALCNRIVSWVCSISVFEILSDSRRDDMTEFLYVLGFVTISIHIYKIW